MTDDGRGSRGGSGSGSRGRTGASQFIASRRPSQAKAEATAAATKSDSKSSDTKASDAKASEARPKRRRRRSTAASKPEAAKTTTTTTTESKAAESKATETKAAPKAAEAAAEAAEEKAAEAAVASAAAGAAATTATTAAPEKSPSRSSRSSADDDGDLSAIRRLVEDQSAALDSLRAEFVALEGRVEHAGKRARLGVFVDVPNLLYGQDADEKPLNAGKLLALIAKGRDLVRATAYSPVSDDPSEALEQQKFVAPFVPYEYRIVTKPLKRFADGSIKGNFDVEMAIDMVTMADRLDVIAIVSGDADFARAVETVQSRGVRVEVVAFARSTSLEMRALADHYVELGKIVEQIR